MASKYIVEYIARGKASHLKLIVFKIIVMLGTVTSNLKESQRVGCFM